MSENDDDDDDSGKKWSEDTNALMTKQFRFNIIPSPTYLHSHTLIKHERISWNKNVCQPTDLTARVNVMDKYARLDFGIQQIHLSENISIH